MKPSYMLECTHAKDIWQVSDFSDLLVDAPNSSFVERYQWLANKVPTLHNICSLAWTAWFCLNRIIIEQENINSPSMACYFVKLVHDY